MILNSSRSAAFLASFIGLTWSGVCLGRSKIAYRLINTSLSIGLIRNRSTTPKRVTITDLDSSVAPQFGSLLAGLSILIENKKRRGEMALYVATRALCATIDEMLPAWLRSRIKKNRWVSIWVERITFSISIGIIICAIVHHPDHVRGIVQGILKYAIGPDRPNDDPKPSDHHGPLDPSISSQTHSSSPSIGVHSSITPSTDTFSSSKENRPG